MFHNQEDFQYHAKGSNSTIFENQSHHQEYFRHRNLHGCFGVVGVFYFERHTNNYLDNDEWALISPKLKMRLIILGRREYMLELQC